MRLLSMCWLVPAVAVATATSVVRAESVGPAPPGDCDQRLAPLTPSAPACDALYFALLDFAPPDLTSATATLDGVSIGVTVTASNIEYTTTRVRTCDADCTLLQLQTTSYLEHFRIVPDAPLSAGTLVVSFSGGESIEFAIEGEDCPAPGSDHGVVCGPMTCEPGRDCQRPDGGVGDPDTGVLDPDADLAPDSGTGNRDSGIGADDDADDGAGCACRAGARAGDGAASALLVLLVVASCASRRRRRTRRQPSTF